MTYRITANRDQWTLNRVITRGSRSKNPGTQTLQPLSYHLTLQEAVSAAQNRILRDLWPDGGVDPADVPEAVSALTRTVEERLRDVRKPAEAGEED